MNLGTKIWNAYWFFKDLRVVRKFNKDPDCYSLILPRNTRKVFVDIYIRAGALLEKKEQAGIGHLLEHYIAELASKKLPSGVEFGAKINDDYLVFYFESSNSKVLSSAVDTFLAILSSPDFSHREVFEYEKRSLVNELEEEKNNTELAFERVIERARYVDEPNGRSFVDHLEKLEGLSLEDIARYHKGILTKNNLKVFVSAARSDLKLANSLRNRLSALGLPEGSIDFPEPIYSDFLITNIENPNISGNYLAVTFPSLNRSAEVKERMAFSLLVGVMRSTVENEEMRQKIREEGIYDFKIVDNQGACNGYLAIQSYVNQAQILPWIEVTLSLISRLKNTGPDSLLFKKTKENWMRNMLGYWRSNQGRFNILTDLILDQQKIHTPRELREIIAAIKEQDLREVAQRIFDLRHINLILFGQKIGMSAEDLKQRITF